MPGAAMARILWAHLVISEGAYTHQEGTDNDHHDPGIGRSYPPSRRAEIDPEFWWWRSLYESINHEANSG